METRERLQGGDEFRAFLKRERARSDRIGQPLAVLAFDIGTEPERARILIEVVAGRVRATDAYGWLEEGRLGVALIGTTVRIAMGVATQIQEQFSGRGRTVACTAYGYPPYRYDEDESAEGEQASAGSKDSATDSATDSRVEIVPRAAKDPTSRSGRRTEERRQGQS